MARTDIVNDRAEALLAELEQEARTTRRVLGRYPTTPLSPPEASRRKRPVPRSC